MVLRKNYLIRDPKEMAKIALHMLHDKEDCHTVILLLNMNVVQLSREIIIFECSELPQDSYFSINLPRLVHTARW